MSIQVGSTTDTKEAVNSVNGTLAKPEVKTGASAATPEKVTAETTEESETSNDEEIEAASETEPKEEAERVRRPGGFKKKIDKQNKKISALENEVRTLREQSLRNQNTQTDKTIEKVEPVQAKGEPNSDDFEKHEDYIKALTRWEVSEVKRKDDEKAQASKRQDEGKKLFEKVKANIEAFQAEHPDYNDVLEEAADITFPEALQFAIFESENPARLGYELSKNKAELARIAALPVEKMERALGRFEARLPELTAPQKEETTETRTSRAPAPIKPVGSQSTGSGKKNLSSPNLTQREYEQLRAEQRKAQRA